MVLNTVFFLTLLKASSRLLFFFSVLLKTNKAIVNQKNMINLGLSIDPNTLEPPVSWLVSANEKNVIDINEL